MSADTCSVLKSPLISELLMAAIIQSFSITKIF